MYYELGRLAQGFKKHKEIDAILFMCRSETSKGGGGGG